MGIISRARNHLNARYPTGAAFIHVPKCAGTSVEEALRKAYRFTHERIYPMESRLAAKALAPELDSEALELEANRHRKYLMAYALQRGARCVTGHCPYDANLHDRFSGSHKFIAVLRDPVARYCSHFRHFYRSGTATSIDMELDEFLETPRALTMGHAYAAYFSSGDAAADLRSSKTITAAKESIARLDLVGFTDNMDEFTASLSRLIGRPVRIGHVNAIASRQNAYRGEITAEQKRKIAKLCEPDLEIYEYARMSRA